MRLLRSIDLPPVWLALFLGLVWVIGLVPLRLFGGLGHEVGWPLIGAGLLLMAVAAAQMVLARTTFVPRRDPKALVTGGVFSLSRNPIYLGDAFVLLGAIFVRDAVLALPLVPLFAGVITRRFISGEEARLRVAFGSDYAAWAERTRRWI